jgi:oligoendopeptidase F
MNRFENAVHTERRENGELSTEKFSELWITTQKEMFGDSVTLTDNYKLWWSYIPHFLHTPGYVYSYAFGELLALSLYEKYKEEGETFIPKYKELLASGGKDIPSKLLENLGISIDDPNFWLKGLKIIDNLLDQTEELI